jgi:hypothetical protein
MAGDGRPQREVPIVDEMTVEGRLAALEAEIVELRAQLAARVPSAGSPPQPVAGNEMDPPARILTSRRAVLGGAVAAAAAVTGALASSQPAAATTGAMQYGAANNAGSAATTLTSSGSPALGVTNTGGGSAVSATGSTGTAIDASATTGRAVNITTTSGVGIWSQTDSGVAGLFNSASGGGVEVLAPRWHLWLRALGRVAPTEDSVLHVEGEVLLDGAHDLWVCIEDGTPGVWRKLGGGGTAGAFHLLPAPVRIYDSRPGTSPTAGAKKPLGPSEVRVLDAAANNTGVPLGATGVAVTCMVVNAAAGSGNFTIWADGVARPAANTMVWGGSDGRHSTFALSALSAERKLKVSSSLRTDVVVDVVGYYR